MKRLLFVLLSCIGLSVSAQDVAVKSNLLYDAALNINGGVEFGVAPKWTVDVTANCTQHQWRCGVWCRAEMDCRCNGKL